MNSWVLLVLVGWGLSSLIYIGSPVNYPPPMERWTKLITISAAGIVGGPLGGAIIHASDPMAGLVSALAGSAILTAVVLAATGKGRAAH